MKRLMMIMMAMCALNAYATTETINWYANGQLVSITTCSSGDSVTPPSAPAKYGYHFVYWQPNLLSGYNTDDFQLLDNNILSNIAVDTRQNFEFFVQAIKYDGSYENLAYGSISTTGYKEFTFTVPDNVSSLNFKHNGAIHDLNIFGSNYNLPPNVYKVSFNVLSVDPSQVGGLQLQNIVVNVVNGD